MLLSPPSYPTPTFTVSVPPYTPWTPFSIHPPDALRLFLPVPVTWLSASPAHLFSLSLNSPAVLTGPFPLDPAFCFLCSEIGFSSLPTCCQPVSLFMTIFLSKFPFILSACLILRSPPIAAEIHYRITYIHAVNSFVSLHFLLFIAVKYEGRWPRS